MGDISGARDKKHPQNEPKKAPKMTQNRPKTAKNDPKMTPKLNKIQARHSKTHSTIIPKNTKNTPKNSSKNTSKNSPKIDQKQDLTIFSRNKTRRWFCQKKVRPKHRKNDPKTAKK